MSEIRDRSIYGYLTEEEEAILYKLTEELDASDGEVIGRALKVLQRLREFVGE